MTFMGPLQRVTTQVGLEKGLGLKSTSATQAIHCATLIVNDIQIRERLRAQIHFSHTSYSLQIPALTRTLNSEVSTPKKQHLMIFMRALLTTIIGQCRVKTLNTELAIACLYKAVMRFMSSQNAPKCATLIVNDIHSP